MPFILLYIISVNCFIALLDSVKFICYFLLQCHEIIDAYLSRGYKEINTAIL